MLTEREQEVLQFIKGYIVENGFAPSIRDIGQALFMCKTQASRYLTQLEDKGRIQRVQRMPRAIRLLA